MSLFQPNVTEEAAAVVLKRHYGVSASNLVPLEGGQISRTYAFSAAGDEYVLRFNRDNHDANFEKDAYVVRRFGSTRVPIPEVICVGRHGDLHYCISRKAPGRRLSVLADDEMRAVLPSLLQTLHGVHTSDLTGTSGYGLFDGEGRGFRSIWTDDLSIVRQEGREDGFYGRWHSLFSTSFLERSLFDRIYGRMETLFPYCPDERRLVHGNFSFGNTLSLDGRISAVIDWLDARFGDFLFDVASLDFWHGEYGFRDLYRTHAARIRDLPQDYERRLLCYQCCIALDGFRFFALGNRPESYQWVKDRILALCRSADAADGSTQARSGDRVFPPEHRLERAIPEWTTTAALAAAAEGWIEEWVHAYLNAGHWANPAFSDGLHLCRRWWRGPLLLPLRDLRRVCGPEEIMTFRQPLLDWEEQVARLMNLADPMDVPPLIVEYRAGVLVVCDGSHRIGAMRRLGWERCWCVLWYNREEDFVADARRGLPIQHGGDGSA